MSSDQRRQPHPSDSPGRDYFHDAADERAKSDSDADRSHSSGPSGPSEPRRPGAALRQSPLREDLDTTPGEAGLIPGELLLREEPVTINQGLEVTTLQVSNTSDRPIQVGSHYHFAEVNAALEFDRTLAWGQRMNVLSGGAMRFEPGVVVEVELVPIRGRRIVPGLRGLCGGELDD